MMPDENFQSAPPLIRWRVQPVRVTYALLALMGVVYALQIISEAALGTDYPVLLGAVWKEALSAGQWWRLLTPLFLHGSLMHIGFNAYALLIFGREIEPLLGWRQFLLFYLVSGVGGNVFSAVFGNAVSVGASTALFGLIAFQIVFIYRNRKFFGDRADGMLYQALGIAGLNFVIGLAPGIDNWGHLGGFVAGLALAWLSGLHLQPVALSESVIEIQAVSPRWALERAAGLVLVILLALLWAGVR